MDTHNAVTTIPLSSIKMSNELDKIFTAISALQGEMEAVKKANHGHRHRYADINAVLDAVRPLLARNSLSVMQHPHTDSNGNHYLMTMVGHASGQWISSSLGIEVTQEEIQQFGGAITYLRRYALVSILGIEQEDDDGNGVMKRSWQGSSGTNMGSFKNPHTVKVEQATDAQISTIKRLVEKLDDTEGRWTNWILNTHKIDALEKLTKESAGSVISALHKRAQQ